MKTKKGRIEALWEEGLVTVESWSEWDRSYVGIEAKQTDKTIAEWWDEDVEQLFEDGFFERGKNFERSVVQYADHLGLSSKTHPTFRKGKPSLGLISPKPQMKKRTRLLKVGDPVTFHMFNQPGNPWWTFWVMAIDRDGDITFTSESRLSTDWQINAEHFRLTNREMNKAFRDGSAIGPDTQFGATPGGRRTSPPPLFGLIVGLALLAAFYKR